MRAIKKSVRLPAQRRYGSQKAVGKVGDGSRFYSTIVGESKSVRVGPLSSGFLWSCDLGNGLVTECVASRLSSRFANGGGDADDGVGDDGR